MGACGGPEGAKLMTLLQLGRGHAILTLVFLQISRQLHGHRTYLRPGGAFLMGVASLQEGHPTTCCSRFPEMSIIPWQTRHVTTGVPPVTVVYDGGGTSSTEVTTSPPGGIESLFEPLRGLNGVKALFAPPFDEVAGTVPVSGSVDLRRG